MRGVTALECKEELDALVLSGMKLRLRRSSEASKGIFLKVSERLADTASLEVKASALLME